MATMVVAECVGCQEECDEFDATFCVVCGRLCHEYCGMTAELPVIIAGNFYCTDCK